MLFFVRVPGLKDRLSVEADSSFFALSAVASALQLDRSALFIVSRAGEEFGLIEVGLCAVGGKGAYGTRLKNAARAKRRFEDDSAARTLDGRRVSDVRDEQRLRAAILKPASVPAQRTLPTPPRTAIPRPDFSNSILIGLRERRQ